MGTISYNLPIRRDQLVTQLTTSHTSSQGVDTIPLFPLGALLYPGSSLELRIFEPRYLALVEHCLQTGGGFGVVRIQEGVEALREPDARQPILSSVGSHVHITDHLALPDGQKRISILAGQRFEVLGTSEQPDRLLMGRIAWLHDEADETIPPELERLVGLLREFVSEHGPQDIDVDLDDASDVSWWLARLIVRDAGLGQQILSLNSPVERLRTMSEVLSMQGAD